MRLAHDYQGVSIRLADERLAHVLKHTEEPSSRSAGPRDLSELVARKWTADRYGTRAKSQGLRAGRGETVSSGSGPGGSRFCSR